MERRIYALVSDYNQHIFKATYSPLPPVMAGEKIKSESRDAGIGSDLQ